MDLLIVVSTEAAKPVFTALANACARAQCQWAVFFTHRGTMIAANEQVAQAVMSASQAIACHDSWERFVSADVEISSAIEMGSQTNHSEMAGQADRIISL